MESCGSRRRLFGVELKGGDVKRMNDEDVTMWVNVAGWGSCAVVGELVGVVADVARRAGQGEIVVSCTFYEAGDVVGDVEDGPVPIAGRRGRIGIEAGNRKALCVFRETEPLEGGRDVIHKAKVAIWHDAAIDQRRTRQGERGNGW